MKGQRGHFSVLYVGECAPDCVRGAGGGVESRALNTPADPGLGKGPQARALGETQTGCGTGRGVARLLQDTLWILTDSEPGGCMSIGNTKAAGRSE